ncbi:MAG: hypothetical protein FWD33_02715 [Alphaproteobacteria bacterium]|nr:hypothetical protein [Alphaproteobacteria bacterium]
MTMTKQMLEHAAGKQMDAQNLRNCYSIIVNNHIIGCECYYCMRMAELTKEIYSNPIKVLGGGNKLAAEIEQLTATNPVNMNDVITNYIAKMADSEEFNTEIYETMDYYESLCYISALEKLEKKFEEYVFKCQANANQAQKDYYSLMPAVKELAETEEGTCFYGNIGKIQKTLKNRRAKNYVEFSEKLENSEEYQAVVRYAIASGEMDQQVEAAKKRLVKATDEYASTMQELTKIRNELSTVRAHFNIGKVA